MPGALSSLKSLNPESAAGKWLLAANWSFQIHLFIQRTVTPGRTILKYWLFYFQSSPRYCHLVHLEKKVLFANSISCLLLYSCTNFKSTKVYWASNMGHALFWTLKILQVKWNMVPATAVVFRIVSYNTITRYNTIGWSNGTWTEQNGTTTSLCFPSTFSKPLTCPVNILLLPRQHSFLLSATVHTLTSFPPNTQSLCLAKT